VVHGLADILHVGQDALRDGLLREVQHREHLLVRFVHFERACVEMRRELVQRDPLQRRLMLTLHPLFLLLFYQFLGFEDSCAHIFLASQRGVP